MKTSLFILYLGFRCYFTHFEFSQTSKCGEKKKSKQKKKTINKQTNKKNKTVITTIKKHIENHQRVEHTARIGLSPLGYSRQEPR